MNKTADIVIIGGGISGCSIAYNLAMKGVKNIIVLEKKYLASGSTGRCGAGIRMQWGTKRNCQLSKMSVDFFENANEILGYKRDIEFKQGGYLIVAGRPEEDAQFRENVKLQNSLGIPSVYLTPKEAKEIIPYMDESKIIGATFCPKDGHLNPFHTTEAYANAARRLGVEIMTFTEVTGIKVEKGKIKGVETNKGYISTPIVVNAAGGYAKKIGDMVGIDIPVYAERHQVLITEPVEPMQGPMFMGFSLNIYAQQTPHGSFIIGRGDPTEPRDLRITSSWQFMEKMAKTTLELLPLLGELAIVRQWAGLYTMTEDAQPIYGEVEEVEGFYLAVGFSGHGFMLGPATGLLIAETILGEETTIDISDLNMKRFEKGDLIFEPSVV